MSASARQQDKGFADKRPNLGLRQLVEMPIYNGAFSNELYVENVEFLHICSRHQTLLCLSPLPTDQLK